MGEVLIASQVGLSQPQAHSPYCVLFSSGLHLRSSFFFSCGLPANKEFMQICSGLGKHVSNSLLSLSFSLWRPNWFPRWFSGKGSACCCRRCRFDSSVGKIPCRKKWRPTSVFLLKESHGQRSLVGWGCKESNMTENAHRHGGLITLIPVNIYASAVRQQIFDPSHFLKAAKHISSMVSSEGPLGIMVF